MAAEKDTYRTLKGKSESLYKVKGSKHFGYAMPAYDRDQVRDILEEVRKEHHAARHHCYAYALGLNGEDYRANDDGEPSNSAGKPILGQIHSFDLTNVLIVVVRYFGGTKLGVGGLIDAYRTAARTAIEANKIVVRKVMNTYRIKFEYSVMSEVMNFLKGENLEFYDHTFETSCELFVDVRLSHAQSFEELLSSIEKVKFELVRTA